MLNLWKYKYFIDVVDYKSFTKAGKKNFVTQTAISQQISALEKIIGEKLLERGGGELKPTEFGKIVYTRSKEMLKMHEQMMREIKHLKEKSLLRIGVDNSINKRLWMKLQQVIDEFYEEEVLAKNRVGIHVGDNTTLPVTQPMRLQDLKGYKRYATKGYPCSMQEKALEQCEELTKETLYVSNIDTVKIKVELNDGYMFADSYYFSYAVGDTVILEDYDEECVLKLYYRKNEEKIEKFIRHLREVLKR